METCYWLQWLLPCTRFTRQDVEGNATPIDSSLPITSSLLVDTWWHVGKICSRSMNGGGGNAADGNHRVHSEKKAVNMNMKLTSPSQVQIRLSQTFVTLLVHQTLQRKHQQLLQTTANKTLTHTCGWKICSEVVGRTQLYTRSLKKLWLSNAIMQLCTCSWHAYTLSHTHTTYTWHATLST